jgi:hypothetical protein
MARQTARQYEINAALHKASGVRIVTTTKTAGQEPNWTASPEPAESSLKAVRLRVAALELGRMVDMR